MEPTASPAVRREPRQVEQGQGTAARQSFCRKCGQPGDVAVQISVKQRGRAGRRAGGLLKAKNCILCDYCAAALLNWPTT